METTTSAKIDKNIVKFLEAESNMTLATCVDNIPHCANCFYIFIEECALIVFKSSKETRHVQNAIENPNVAGSVLPEKSEFGKIKGLQFEGFFKGTGEEISDIVKFSYYKKYPFALAMKGELWAIELSSIKMVESTMGFGKKLEWSVNHPYPKG